MEGASSCRGFLEAAPFFDLASGPFFALLIIVRICSECVTAPAVSEHVLAMHARRRPTLPID